MPPQFPYQSSLVVNVDDVGRVLEVVKLVDLDGVLAAGGCLPDGRGDGDAGQRVLVVLDL